MNQQTVNHPQAAAPSVYVRFGSHRARDYGFRALGRKPQGFFSNNRETGPGGTYLVTPDELEVMRNFSRLVRFTILRGPHNDLMKCWSI